MDLVRFGIDQIVATTVAFRLPGAFGTSVSVASLYDLTPTANGDLLIHNAASSFNLASGPIALFGTQPVSAFGTVEAGGSQINYSSRFGALQFDAVAVSTGVMSVRADAHPVQFQTGRNILGERFPDDFSSVTGFTVTGEIAGEQSRPAIAASRNGASALAVWTDTAWPGSSDTDVIGYAVDASGNALSASFRLSEAGTSAGTQDMAKIAAAGDHFAASWVSGSSVKGRMFSTTGMALAAEFTIGEASGHEIVQSRLIGLQGGGFVAIWQERTSGGNDHSVHYRVFDASGNPLGAAELPYGSGGIQGLYGAAATGDGGFALLFSDSALGGSFLRVFNADGTGYAGPVQVNRPGELALMADGRLALVSDRFFNDPVTSQARQETHLQFIDTRDEGIQLVGTASADNYLGSDFADAIDGGAGDDLIAGGAGSDVIFGRDGNDAINGEAGDDNLQGFDGADTIFGGGGNDVILGQSGDDILWGEDNVSAGGGADQIDGGDGNDIILGQGGGDILFGRAGSDYICGGTGADILAGGAGSDLFVVGWGEGTDTLLDLNEGGDKDGFDLRGYFDAIGYGGTNPRADGVLGVFQNGADAHVVVQGVTLFILKNVTAAALDDSYFLFQ